MDAKSLSRQSISRLWSSATSSQRRLSSPPPPYAGGPDSSLTIVSGREKSVTAAATTTPGFYRFPPLGYNVKPCVEGTFTEPESDRVNSDFKRGLDKLYDGRFEEANFSDLIVKCREYTFYVHRVILCPQSAFFAEALKPEFSFQDAQPSIISLDEDEPELVDGLLGYFYTSRVQVDRLINSSDLAANVGSSMMYLVGLYAIAEKYQVSELKEQAWRHFMDDAVRLRGWREPNFPQVVTKIFETTPESDKRLRCVALAIIKTRLKYFTRNPAFVEEMDRIEGFWAAFAQYSATWPWMELYRCVTCGEVMMNLPWEEDERSPPCWGCGTVEDHKTWRASIIKYDPNDEEMMEEAERASKRQRTD